MSFFSKQIDKRNRQAMIDFLSGHFRYDTTNSWNRETSYANLVKVHHLNLPPEIRSKAYDMVNLDEVNESLNDIIAQWDEDHNWKYQARFNGRSGGYLVLYQGGRRISDHKSYCTNCGQRNFQSATEENKTCGVCRKPTRVNHTFYETYTNGMGIDMDEDFQEWSMRRLRERVELVQSFDKLCDDLRDEFIHLCQNFCVVEKEIMVPKKIRVLSGCA